MLQHRGQDSAGMVSTDWDHFVEHKGNGLVRDVFKEEKVMSSLKGMPPTLRYHATVRSHSSSWTFSGLDSLQKPVSGPLF